MKKYIAPVVRNINIEMESIVAMSNMDRMGNNVDLSNKRQRTASEVIWGFDDEADRDY